MRLTTVRELLNQAIDHIEENNNCLIESHTCPLSGQIEPESVAEHVGRVNAWLENAKNAVRLRELAIPLQLPYKDLPA